jgi:hypothetical protein
VDELPNLNPAERRAIQRHLSEMAPEVRHQTRVTLGEVPLRDGPGPDHDLLMALPPLTTIQVLEEVGEWLRVTALGRVGYLRRDLLRPVDQPLQPGFLRSRPELAQAPLPPPASERISDVVAADRMASTLAEVWNRFGGLFLVLAAELGIEPAVAAAVFVTEAPRGRGFGPDGRLIIRFENHIFFRRWGAQHGDRFSTYFRFNVNEAWRGHQWRPSRDEAWRDFHGNQDAEWAVFEFAGTLDDTTAKLSISMGAPQVMGFNHALIGYETVGEMFDAFTAGEREQVIGFFDFIKGSGTESRMLRALQQGQMEAFAAIYNGPGQAAHYGDLISRRLEIMQRLRRGQPVPAPVSLETVAEEPVSFAVPGMTAPAEDVAGTTTVAPVAPDAGASAKRSFAASRESAVSFLPPPGDDEGDRPLAERDPQLYEYWREHVRQGYQRNDEMFRRILDGFMTPYYTTVWMYRILFGVGIASFLVAAGVSVWLQSAVFGLVFGGLSIAAFLAYFVSRPLLSLEQNLKFVTWLGVVYNTYWTRLTELHDRQTVQQDLHALPQDTIADLVELIDKHAAASDRRPNGT